MDAITIGEPDRDGDNDNMIRGAGLFGHGVAQKATRSVSRGRTMMRSREGSSVPAEEGTPRRAPEARKALDQDEASDGEEGPGNGGRGAKARGKGKGKGKKKKRKGKKKGW